TCSTAESSHGCYRLGFPVVTRLAGICAGHLRGMTKVHDVSLPFAHTAAELGTVNPDAARSGSRIRRVELLAKPAGVAAAAWPFFFVLQGLFLGIGGMDERVLASCGLWNETGPFAVRGCDS